MKLTASKQELLGKLSDIQNIVEKRNTMPILSHFLLDATKSGASITATDLETAIREPIEVTADKPGRLCIPARKLFEIVREVEGDISLDSSDDGRWLKVKAGASNFRLACLSTEEFPAWPALEEADEIAINCRELGEMIEKTIYAAGEADTRYTLNGLLFHAEGGRLSVVGTDGHRLALISKPIAKPPKEEKKIILPRKAASELRKFLDKDGEISMLVGKNHVLFKVDGVEFLARLIEGSYPNYSQVVPSGNQKKLVIEREAFVHSLRRVSIMSRDRSNAVKAEIAPGKLSLASSNPDLGEASDEISINYSGEAVAIGFNARYLLDALSAVDSDNVVFEIQDQLSPTLLMKEGSEDYKCVVMPMRI